MSSGQKRREPVARLFYRPQEAADALSISVRKMRDLIRAGVVPSVRLGRTRLVPVAALERLADLQSDAAQDGSVRRTEESVQSAGTASGQSPTKRSQRATPPPGLDASDGRRRLYPKRGQIQHHRVADREAP